MTPVAVFKFEANALFAAEQLQREGIYADFSHYPEADPPGFYLEVDAEYQDPAKRILAKLEVDESALDQDSEGYLDGHMEWSQKMYDPGHYTGGKIPHYLFNKDIWKYIAPLYLVGGIASLAFIFLTGANLEAETFLWIGLYLFVGLSMFWQLSQKRKK